MSLAEYVGAYKKFMRGKYQYRQIKDPATAEKYIQEGRKIVLPQVGGYQMFLYMGGILLVANSIVSLLALLFGELNAEDQGLIQVVLWGCVGGIGGVLFMIGIFMRSGISFYVLGTEGIVYRVQRSEGPQLARWQDVEKIKTLDVPFRSRGGIVHYGKEYEKRVKIDFNDGKIINLHNGFLTLKEFPMMRTISRNKLNELFVFTVQGYCEYYRGKHTGKR